MSGVKLETEYPLARKEYQIVALLWLMRKGPIYGYDIASRYKEMTNHHMKISYGIVYPFLRRMETRGLAVSAKDQSAGRVYYTLTPRGKSTLKQLLSRLEENRKYFDEILLGFLAIYSELFGRKTLDALLTRARQS
jgi:DNA-binding PadR family transcriptional regulator